MKLFSLSLLAVGALFLAGCTGDSASSEPSAKEAGDKSAAQGKTFTIGMSQCNLGEPYRAQMNADIQEAAKAHPELRIIYKDAQNDSLKQRSQIEEFVQAKVDLIMISPKEAQPLTEPVAKAMDAGIPVIVIDRELMGDKYTCFIGANNEVIGRAAGKWLATKLGGKGTIVELKGLMTSTPAQDRHKGFRDGIKDAQFEIAFEAEMKWLEPEARKEMDSALARVKKIDAVFAHNDPGAHGAYLAAESAGRKEGTLFIGIDSLPQEGQAYVKQGILAASFEYPTGGKESVEAALKILKGEKVEKKIILESRFFTPENVEKGGEPLPKG